MADQTHSDTAVAKAKYHHGDLREALISASYDIVRERGAAQFALSDACRRAGVSTAAPYKHFRDRTEILGEVAQRAFQKIGDDGVTAARAAGEGTLDGIIALNLAYVDFAVDEPALFRLMFGQNPELREREKVMACGQHCFRRVVEQFELYCHRNQPHADAEMICMRVWTFVHGMASLLIDEDYEAVSPAFDHRTLLVTSTPKLLTP
ncbi:MAG: TetR/AcrR family transcriptional regulator [Pseudomonadota bacterium]